MIKIKFDTINKFFFFLNDILNQNNKRPHRKIYSQTQSARNKKKFNIAADQLYAVSKTQYIFSDQNTNSSSDTKTTNKKKPANTQHDKNSRQSFVFNDIILPLNKVFRFF